MSLPSLIETIRSRLAEGSYQNEAAVSVGIVLPILRAIGWDDTDPAQVAPEFSMPGGRVDFALFSGTRRPSVFVEVKGVGRATSGDRQLFEYAFHQGVPICVLTDGREWSFYYPPGEGDYSQRRVQKLHLVERNKDELESTFIRYLSRERVRTGEARDAVDLDFRDLRSRREAQRSIPKAWDLLVREPEEFLVELLQDQTEAISGTRPSSISVLNFLRSLAPPVHDEKPVLPILSKESSARSIDTSVAASLSERRDSIPNGMNISFEVFGEGRTAKNAKSALVQILREIASRYPERMSEIAERVRGKSRNHIAQRPEDIYPKRPDLANAEEIWDGWLVGTNIANREKIRIIRAACEAVGLSMGKEVKLELPNT